MSLFQFKSLWGKSYGGEQFDERHLDVGRIGKWPSFALGSFKGVLRVLALTSITQFEMRIIYQNVFDSPIIDVKFVKQPEERNKALALGVLFFRKFAYLTFDRDSDFSCKMMYVDVEPSFAINKTPVSVMTLNSSLQYLNPLQTLKIQVGNPIYPFATNGVSFYFIDGEELVEIEGSSEQWRIIVGPVRSLFVVGANVVLVGDRALWEVSKACITKTKVMEEEVSCGTLALKDNDEYNILVCNFNQQILVYSSDYELLWAMKVGHVILSLFVSNIEQIKGMLVYLTEDGSLQLGYTGTETPETILEPLSEHIDMGAVESETEACLQQLKSKTQTQGKPAKAAIDPSSLLRIRVGKVETSLQHREDRERLCKIDGKLAKCEVVCESAGKELLTNVGFSLVLPTNLKCDAPERFLALLKPTDKVEFTIYADNESYPYQTQARVLVRYEAGDGNKHTCHLSVNIPMRLQCRVASWDWSTPPQAHKILIKSSKELPSFNMIFPQLVSEPGEQRKAIELELSNQVRCGVVFNKSFNKVKIESQFYSGLSYALSSCSEHISAYNQKSKGGIELSVEIPLEEFFQIMRDHFDCRGKLKEAIKNLQVCSEEFRKAEKKLLVRMKEKISTVSGIEKLLEYTYERLMASAASFEAVSEEMEIINHNLTVAIKLVLDLLFIRANPSASARRIAEGIIGYEKEGRDSGWEQKVMANAAHYLNRKYTRGDPIIFDHLQKIPLYVISRVNSGDWNQ